MLQGSPRWGQQFKIIRQYKMVINLSKTKEIVFRRPCPIRFRLAPSISVIALVDHDIVKSLKIILQQCLLFDYHITTLFKQCSQRIYLLRMLRSHGLFSDQLHTVHVALAVTRILYALPAWGAFATVG